MENNEESKDSQNQKKKKFEADLEDLKKRVKQEIRKELKRELLEEIYNELKNEESEEVKEDSRKKVITEILSEVEPAPEEKSKPEVRQIKDADVKIIVTIPTFLKIASHALKYANENIPKDKWVEVIGLLAGRIDKGTGILHIEDAYPMGHGNAVYAEIKDYKNFITAFNDLKKRGFFICGWYHSHPTYGLFLSGEDMGTQRRYQSLWKDSVALVIDPYQIDGTSFGFDIFRANLRQKKWFPVPFKLKDDIDVATLPELLKFINPIIDGNALFMEYDGG
ncbi:MAG: hypothetical protein GF364_16315 [Candidatus Lokiarchaeota archaeon]|nr:hypothetical protein [Candidatus Lokiarchaeota archaeon]